MKIIVVDGYSASSRADVNLIANKVRRAATELDLNFELFTVNSPWIYFPKTRIKKFLKKNPPSECKEIALFGKSFGAFILCELIQSGVFTQYEQVSFLSIDPHAPAGCANADIPIDLLTHGPVIPTINIHQNSEYPTGARINGATNILITGVDHFSIVHSRTVKHYITECLAGFKHDT